MHLTATQEISYFQGNAERNLGKLSRSGIITKIIRYCNKIRSNEKSKIKPLELEIPQGNPEDAYVLIESIIAQQQRKKINQENRLPKGHTRSPKLGAANYAFKKARLNPTDAANYVSRRRNTVIISPEGAELFDDFLKNTEYLGNDVF